MIIKNNINSLKVKFKKLHPQAVMPAYAKKGDAAMDLYAAEIKQDKWGNYVYLTGVALEIPPGFVGLLFPRSSVSKTSLSLANSVGVVDSGYRGEIMLKFGCSSNLSCYKVGDRVGQLIIMPYPQVQFEQVEELSDSDRGEGGFGSTGA